MIEVGSCWKHIFTGKIVRIVEIKNSEIVIEWIVKNVTFNMTYDKEFILTCFEQMTPLEVELL